MTRGIIIQELSEFQAESKRLKSTLDRISGGCQSFRLGLGGRIEPGQAGRDTSAFSSMFGRVQGDPGLAEAQALVAGQDGADPRRTFVVVI